jgi:DNA-binding transcriptional LysR family regulator
VRQIVLTAELLDNPSQIQLTFRGIREMDRIDALRYLIDIAEMGSFSAVARQRSVATSTVTLAISQLEQEFAVPLLARSTRRLVFTHEGLALLGDAKRIVAEWTRR